MTIFTWSKRTLRRTLVVAMPPAAVVMMAACGSTPAPDQVTATGLTGAGCPAAITRLVDPSKTAANEYGVQVDKSKSDFSTPDSKARVQAQVAALIDRAVIEGAAVHLSVFVGSLATVRDVVVCPTMAVKYHNEAALEARRNHLKKVATEEAWSALLKTDPPVDKPGTSVVGAWRALAEAKPLADHRFAIVLSDGRGLPEDEVEVDLSGYESVGIYGVGVGARHNADTEATVRLCEHWQQWLETHHARNVTVSTGMYR